MKRIINSGKWCWVIVAGCLFVMNNAMAKPNERNKKVIEYWTQERIASAIPRRMVIDKKNGLGYLKRPDGSLVPHGHNIVTELTPLKASLQPTPRAKPGGGNNSDNQGPAIAPIEPADGSTVGASQRFAAKISDTNGIRSATLTIIYPNGNTQNFSLANTSGDVWENTLSGFTDGNWSWRVSATDSSKGKGNTSTQGNWSFTVDTGSGGSGSGNEDSVANTPWVDGGLVQTAAGRLLYEMPTNFRRKRWAAYVCSGTVATDYVTGRSIIITAAHCVYDDANKAFARNVLFIPNQDQTSGSGTDSNCGNDPLGCWTPSFGVIDSNWAATTFPNNIRWDYAYYVVSDSGAHAGTGVSSDALDTAAGNIAIDFSTPVIDDGTASADSPDFAYGLGYSYSDDPNFMYCADDMTSYGADNWWLPICGLSGGSSGGPWIQDMDLSSGSGPIISVNSWGFSNGDPGMAGPKLSDTTAQCIFNEAQSINFANVPTSAGDQGMSVNYCN